MCSKENRSQLPCKQTRDGCTHQHQLISSYHSYQSQKDEIEKRQGQALKRVNLFTAASMVDLSLGVGINCLFFFIRTPRRVLHICNIFRLTAALRPGKLKKVSGPCLWGIWFNTDRSLMACLGCKKKKGKGQKRAGRRGGEEKVTLTWQMPTITDSNKKHGVTSHLHHTGSITLQSPLPSPDNITSLPWQPLIDPTLGRTGGGKRDWESWKNGLR